MRLSANIKKSAVKLGLESRSKDEVLVELVDLLCDAYKLKDRDTILEAIRTRESRQSTGIGMGLAVPHAKTPAVKKLHVAYGLCREGMEFESADGEKAHIFFILVSPKDVSGPHIQALAGISRLIKHEDFRKALLGCDETRRFFDLARAAEEKYL